MLLEVMRHGWYEMPEDKRYNGTGAPGNYLEDLLGLKAGNMDIPDAVGWELKYYTEKTNLITLFHKEARPERVMHYMVRKHGWKDAKGRMSFRHTIKGKSDRFKINTDDNQVTVRPLEGNGPTPYWTHDDLLEIAAGKLRRLILVKGEKKGREVRYLHADCFENIHLSFFIFELMKGTVCIDFDARENEPNGTALRNHGTKFRISPNDVCRLYKKKDRLS